MKLFQFSASLAVLATQAFALFEQVQKLDESNFDDLVMSDDENMWMVTFYAEWCPYCQPFSPEYEAAQVSPVLEDKKIKFGAVDVMQSRDITQRYAI